MSDHYPVAKAAISEAFAAINLIPHGDGLQAERLAEAQQHLAAARRALDAWWAEDMTDSLEDAFDGRPMDADWSTRGESPDPYWMNP